MKSARKKSLQAAAEAEIRHAFVKIKAQTDEAGKDIQAYYFCLVEDFFATTNAAITAQDRREHGPHETLLETIWSGVCPVYEGESQPVDSASDYWLDKESQLYKVAYELIQELGEDDDQYAQYNELRADFEACVIEALKVCDQQGIFGDRGSNGIVLFAFYIDDHDGNGEGSLLYRSTQALNTRHELLGIES